MNTIIITKSYLQSHVDNGLSVKEIREKLVEAYGMAPTVKELRLKIEQFGIEIKRKSKKPVFIFEDDCLLGENDNQVEEVNPLNTIAMYGIV